MEKEPVKIVYQTLKQQIEDGWKMDKLKEYYGLNHSQMKKVLQQTGLTIRKFRNQPAFIIEGLNEEQPQMETKTEEVKREEEPQVENTVEEPFLVTKEELVTESPQKNFWEK